MRGRSTHSRVGHRTRAKSPRGPLQAMSKQGHPQPDHPLTTCFQPHFIRERATVAVSLASVFTGIVEEKGFVESRKGPKLRIRASTVLEGSDIGASIAVNGCCLTVVERGPEWWTADVSDETYLRTNLGNLTEGDPVNLERPMALGERFGGHIVLGHVDAIGHVVCPVPNLVVRIGQELMKYLVEKGSVTVDGISLTVFNLTDDTFEAAVIPHTSAVTTLGHRSSGDAVNIEIDVLAKHIERLMEFRTT